MSAKHTPGQWRIEGATVFSRKENALFRIDPISAEGRLDHEANARLIASAPELLEALRGALQSLAADAEHDEHNGEPGEAVAIYNAARAAIAKATGAGQ